MSARHVIKDRYCKECSTTLKVDAKGMRDHGDRHRADDLEKWRKEYDARPAPKPMEPIEEIGNVD